MWSKTDESLHCSLWLCPQFEQRSEDLQNNRVFKPKHMAMTLQLHLSIHTYLLGIRTYVGKLWQPFVTDLD